MKRTLLGGLTAFAMAVIASAAQASLIGAEVNMTASFTGSPPVTSDPGNRTVSGAVEYGAGAYVGYNPRIQIDIGANQLTILDIQSFPINFSTAPFNGWVLSVISGPSIVSASLDGSSGFAPSAISILDGGLLLNYQGIQAAAGTVSVINFTTDADVPVPEPTSMAMFATGLFLLGFAMRRRRGIAWRR